MKSVSKAPVVVDVYNSKTLFLKTIRFPYQMEISISMSIKPLTNSNFQSILKLKTQFQVYKIPMFLCVIAKILNVSNHIANAFKMGNSVLKNVAVNHVKTKSTVNNVKQPFKP